MSEKVLVLEGATFLRVLAREAKRKNKKNNFIKSYVIKKNEKGKNRWVKGYYFQIIERKEAVAAGFTTKDEQYYLDKGYKPYSSQVKIYKKYVGTEKPEGYEPVILTEWKHEGRLTIVEKNIIVSKKDYQELCNMYTDIKALQAYEIGGDLT